MNHFKFLNKRCRNVGLRRDHSRQIARYFAFQVAHRGYPGAVSFFKRCGDTIVRGATGSGEKSPWVGTRFRYPRSLSFLREYPVDVQLRIAKIARSVRLEKLTEEQVNDAVSAVQTPYGGSLVGMCALSDLVKIGMSTLPNFGFEQRKVRYPQVGRQFTRCKSESGETMSSKTPPIKESLDLYLGTIFENLPNSRMMFYPLAVPASDPDIELVVPRVVGEIHATQEGGCKLRTFASPYTVFQAALTPLHEWLDEVRSTLSTDCTHDQEAGAIWAQTKLENGEELAAVDMRKATCRFPLEPQLEVCHTLGIPDIWIQCFIAVARGVYLVGSELRVGDHRFPDELSWVVGQPLGTRPSMSLFSLTHNLFLRGLCCRLGLDPDTSFVVLGDDVVMIKSLYLSYIEVLQSVDVGISWNKTHVGTTFAEFAGFSITPELRVRPGQWKKVTRTNALSVAESLGTPTYREVSDNVLELQKLWLFGLGLFTPPKEAWGKYLKANSLMREKVLDCPTLWSTTLWTSGFKKTCRAQLGDHVKFYPEKEDFYATMTRALRPYWGVLPDYVSQVFDVFDDIDPPHVANLGSYQVQTWFEKGLIDHQIAFELIEKLSDATRSLLFLPPIRRNKNSHSREFLRRMTEALQNA